MQSTSDLGQYFVLWNECMFDLRRTVQTVHAPSFTRPRDYTGLILVCSFVHQVDCLWGQWMILPAVLFWASLRCSTMCSSSPRAASGTLSKWAKSAPYLCAFMLLLDQHFHFCYAVFNSYPTIIPFWFKVWVMMDINVVSAPINDVVPGRCPARIIMSCNGFIFLPICILYFVYLLKLNIC